MSNTPLHELLAFERRKKTPEYQEHIKGIRSLYPRVYQVDNNFAYNIDTNNEYKTFQNSKLFNFVPTYDNWCLYCDAKKCEKKCSKCKSVYFCNQDCQRKAWKIHKKHCGRNLSHFCLCVLFILE